jgi:hypothetical protein
MKTLVYRPALGGAMAQFNGGEPENSDQARFSMICWTANLQEG